MAKISGWTARQSSTTRRTNIYIYIYICVCVHIYTCVYRTNVKSTPRNRYAKLKLKPMFRAHQFRYSPRSSREVNQAEQLCDSWGRAPVSRRIDRPRPATRVLTSQIAAQQGQCFQLPAGHKGADVAACCAAEQVFPTCSWPP